MVVKIIILAIVAIVENEPVHLLTLEALSSLCDYPKMPMSDPAGNGPPPRTKEIDPRREDQSDDKDYDANHKPGEHKSRIAARCSGANDNRVSVKDQVLEINAKVSKNTELLKDLESRQNADKVTLSRIIEELSEKMKQELEFIRADHEKKLKVANDEIERLSKCLNVQRGSVTTLQEQCQSLHKQTLQLEEDVQTLATEVLGE